MTEKKSTDKNTLKEYVVYILRCSDGTYYTGSTNDFEHRLHQHNFAKSGAHYTKIRRPVSCVYRLECPSYGDARKQEAAIKNLTRIQKEKLISSQIKLSLQTTLEL
jgi:putative endonuclease